MSLKCKEIIKKDGKVYFDFSEGHIGVCDSRDFQRVSSIVWYCIKIAKGFYIVGKVGNTTVTMHSIIGGIGDYTIDHKNLDPRDNTRDNLRLATKQQQSLNRTKLDGVERTSSKGYHTSEYRGVNKRQDNGTFRVRAVNKKKVQVNLGCFRDEVAAAEKWDDFMYEEFKDDFPLQGLEMNGIVGEPTINFIRFNFPERFPI